MRGRMALAQRRAGLPRAWNMAVDEAIMTMVGRKDSPPTLRIYAWQPPGLSLGYFQRSEEVDLAACRSRGVDVVRRPTGGRAILHDQEVTYSLSLPEDLPWLPRGVTEAYRLIAGGLVRGLQAPGGPRRKWPLPPTARPAGSLARRPLASMPPVGYEIVARGRKLVGSAQTRRRRAVLQHGSIPLKLQAEELFALLHFADPGERSRGERLFCGQGDFPRRAVGVSLGSMMFGLAIVRGLGEELGVAFDAGVPSAPPKRSWRASWCGENMRMRNGI
ncbi:MAG: lipoate--protein ligase family protein [Limnochordia bacterium]